MQISVLPHDEAAVGDPSARGVFGQTATRRGERLDKRVALVAGSDCGSVLRQRHVAVVAAGHGGQGARPRRGAAGPLEGRGRERAQVRVGGRAVCLFEVFRRLSLATHALRGQAEVVVSQRGPTRIARERLKLARGLGIAAQPVIRRPEVVAQTRSVYALRERIEERFERPLVVARTKRLYALLESLLGGSRRARGPPRN